MKLTYHNTTKLTTKSPNTIILHTSEYDRNQDWMWSNRGLFREIVMYGPNFYIIQTKTKKGLRAVKEEVGI